MPAFKVFIRRTGGVPTEVDVTAETTMQQIKVSHDLIGHVLTSRGNRKGSDSVADIGIQAGVTISVVKTGWNPKDKAVWRMGRGDTQHSTAHDLAKLETSMVGALMEESEQTRTTVRGESAIVQKGIGNLTAPVRGDTSVCAPDQTSRERRNQLLTQACANENELAGLKAEIKAEDEKKKEDREKVAQERHRTKRRACGG